MSTLIKNATILAFAMTSALALTACNVDKTQEGELPDVDVEVQDPGQVPKYDVDAPDVDVGTKDVTVPVPDIDVEPADEDENDDPNT